MFLKQLELIGFKSFAEKTTIEFVPGVTAVVGPNGSGKSNITDAIRWVLGEQSAKSLRGGKMEDVIFSGSDSRKQLNFAEIALTLNNESGILPVEFNEVCVARRVFRTGESEYLLNGQVCRLKEIVDLFMDSGLGKEAFSIIGQGKVDEILNSKPEERRTIFEEAAGVLKYKTRKKQAESKLSETSENLNRVNDIIHELDGQIEPLQIQASIAKDFLEKKEELQNHEIALTVHEIEFFHESWEKSNQELNRLSSDEKKLSLTVQKNEKQLIESRNKLSSLDEIITQLHEKLLSTTKELENLEGKRELIKERKKNATQNSTQLKDNILDGKETIDQLIKKQQSLTIELNDKKKTVEQLILELDEKKKQENLIDGSIEQTIETLKSDYIELLNEQASAKNELQYLDQQLKQQITRSERLDGENEKYLIERNRITKNLHDKLQLLDEVKEHISKQINQYKQVQLQIETYKKQYDAKQNIVTQANHYLQKAQSRKETLEEMEEEYTGFFQGVKEVLKQRNEQLTGIEGAVAELIEVPTDYSLAIETALGSAMQNIIVMTEAHARNAIKYLKDNRYGRATFLPISILKEKFILPEFRSILKSHPAFIGVAVDLVQYDPKHKKAVSNLLGNIIIANNLSGANSIAKQLQYRYRIVTIDGDIVNPGGSMTGGATKNKTSSVLGRKSELNELKNKLLDMKSQTDQFEQELQETKLKLVNEENKLEEIRAQGEQLRIKQNDIESMITQMKITKKNLDERLTIYDLETVDLKEEKDKISTRSNELAMTIEQCEGKIHILNVKIEQLTIQRNNDRQSKESLTKEITSLSSQLAVAKEQLLSSNAYMKTINKDIADAKNKQAILEDNLHWLENEMTDHHSSEEELFNGVTHKKTEKAEIEQQIANHRNDRSQIQDLINQLDNILKVNKNLYDEVTSKIRTEEIKNNRLDVELENKLNILREEYTLSYEGAKVQYPLSLPIEDTRTKVKLIKQEIEELGSVNIGAIEEYDRVYERYHFLLEQQTDLNRGKRQSISSNGRNGW